MFKQPRIDSKKLRQAANGQSCIKCGNNDGTVVLAHYSGTGSHKFGKGAGQKAEDIFGAHLCYACHNYFDSYAEGNGVERADEFKDAMLMTIKRLFLQKLIKIV